MHSRRAVCAINKNFWYDFDGVQAKSLMEAQQTFHKVS